MKVLNDAATLGRPPRIYPTHSSLCELVWRQPCRIFPERSSKREGQLYNKALHIQRPNGDGDPSKQPIQEKLRHIKLGLTRTRSRTASRGSEESQDHSGSIAGVPIAGKIIVNVRIPTSDDLEPFDRDRKLPRRRFDNQDCPSSGCREGRRTRLRPSVNKLTMGARWTG
jgi:hypothetical protein